MRRDGLRGGTSCAVRRCRAASQLGAISPAPSVLLGPIIADTPAWSRAWLAHLPLPALRRWGRDNNKHGGGGDIQVSVLARADGGTPLRALAASVNTAPRLGGAYETHLYVPSDAAADTLRAAHEWAAGDDGGATHLHYRVVPPRVGALSPEASAALEAWAPGAADKRRALVLLRGDAEVSRALFVYVAHFLLCRRSDGLLGIDLSGGGRGDPADGGCGAVYFGGAWSELREFSTSDRHVESETWTDLSARLERERGYKMHRAEGALCRRQGDAAALADAEALVAELQCDRRDAVADDGVV